MRERIQETMSHFPIREAAPAAKPIKSPFRFGMFARSMAFVLVGFVAGGGGLAFASEQALPGDALYAVKTEITEEVVAAFQTTPEAKIAWEEKRIARRANELSKLQMKGKLVEKRAQIAAEKIEVSNLRVEKEMSRLSDDLSFNGVILPKPITRVASVTAEIESVDTSNIVASRKPARVAFQAASVSMQTKDALKPARVAPARFGDEVLKRLSVEIDKLEANKKLDDQTMSELDTLVEQAEKALQNKETKLFYETIRKIKSILEKHLRN